MKKHFNSWNPMIQYIYRTLAIITRTWLETALDYKQRILCSYFLVYYINCFLILTTLDYLPHLKMGIKNIQAAVFNGPCTVCDVHEFRSYFFLSWIKSKWKQKSIYKPVIWNHIKIKFFDHIVICLLSFEHLSMEPFSSGHIRLLDLLTPNKT